MSLDRRLTDAARLVAERVDPPEVDLGAVRAGARANRRRAVALTVAAAAGVVALAGIPLLTGGRDSTAPQPAAPPTAEVVNQLENIACPKTGCLTPGLYTIPLGYAKDGIARQSVELRLDGSAWGSDGFRHQVWMEEGDHAVSLSVYRPFDLATAAQPCDEATTAVAEDATTPDLAGQLAALPRFRVVSGPTAIQAFGRETQKLVLEADRLVCPPAEGDQYNLADIYGGDGIAPGGDSDIDPDQQVRIRFWVLELGGQPIVVEARQEGLPSDELVARLDQAIATLTFGDQD